MDADEYERMYRVEQEHWWYLGMEVITRAVLDRWLPTRHGLRVLDAGCGTGAALSTYLGDYGMATGVDLSPLLADPSWSPERTLYWRMKHRQQAACVSGPWKYLRVDGHEYLFDVVTDGR